MSRSFEAALASRSDLSIYGNNNHLLFALEIAFQIEDIHSVALDSLTDGKHDKKCDLIYIDTDREMLVVAQGYFANSSKSEAPANKASDLNTAAAWLFGSMSNELPEAIRSAATQVHLAFENDQIRTVQFWYVHNCTESQNVRNELAKVESTVKNAIQARWPASNVLDIRAKEIGSTTLEDWYKSLQAPILVADNFEIDIPGGYAESGADWKAYVTTLEGSWLYEQYKNHGQRLFSANLRGYLGSRRSDTNINHGIKQTAEDEPSRFWVFNNGLTVLVHDFTVDTEAKKLMIKGFSIVNGAQTTGSLGSLSAPPRDVKVQTRIVMCSSMDTIQNIIKFNNSQNPLVSPDFRSNDQIQRRLRQSFVSIPNAEYTGGRRSSEEDIIRRPANLLPSDTVAQALAAVHGYPHVAYHEKSKIWLNDNLYSKFFNENTSAEHIVWCFSLLKSIDNKKLELRNREAEVQSGDIATDQKEELSFLRRRGATILLTTAISRSVETILNRSLPNLFRISFEKSTSPEQAEKYWQPIIDITVPFAPTQLASSLTRGIDNGDATNSNVKNFITMIRATAKTNDAILKEFGSKIVISS